MQSLESLLNSLNVKSSEVVETMPGNFVTYNSIRQKSSHIELASSSGVISKKKKRSQEKTLYEFLSLAVWHELLSRYSKVNDVQFRAPRPIGLFNLNSDKPGLFMEFLNGYELKKFNVLKRTTPVKIKGQKYPIPLYPACALHLGALNRLKEVEGLFHADYANRHIIFSPLENVSIGVVDVENSRVEDSEKVSRESKKLTEKFERVTSSSKDLDVLKTWYSQGTESLVIPDSIPQLNQVVEYVGKIYDINLDFRNMNINNYRLRVPNVPILTD